MRLTASSDVPQGTASAEVIRWLDAISEISLRNCVAHLAKPRNYYAEREINEATARWLSQQFNDWGYVVQNQGKFNNVVALPARSSPTLLIGAHYDSVPQTPGADDNASAVAAMLACAEAVARFVPQASVCFVAFNCEENDLAGSKDFVANFLPQSGIHLDQAHILEMVGFSNSHAGSQKIPTGLPIRIPETADFLGLLADDRSAMGLKLILQQANTYQSDFKVIGLEVPVGIETVFPVLARSDHVPFWHAGIPAVMWTDTSEFRNPHYHRATDTPQTLDYSFLKRVSQLLLASVTAALVS